MRSLEEAQEEAIEMLEAETRRRALVGTEEPVFYRGQVGSPRCAECYPGSRFNLAKHKDLKMLGLKSRPTMRPAQAAAMGKK